MGEGRGQAFFTQIIGSDGTPVSNPRVYHYAAGTTTDKDIWRDTEKNTALPQPFLGDTNGFIYFFGDGDYRFVIQDQNGVTLQDLDYYRLTSDQALIWEGSHGTSLPAVDSDGLNQWHLFAKHDAQDVFQDILINDGTSYVSLSDRLSEGVLNVKDFGALGDGTTDDTTAIQDTIDEAESTGQRVYIPGSSTTYIVTAKITIPSAIEVFGDGGHGDDILTIIEATHSGDDVFRLSGRSARLRNMKIISKGPRLSATIGHGVTIDSGNTGVNISRCRLEDLWIVDQPEDGLHIVKGGIGFYLHITCENCRRYGIYMDDGTDESYTITSTTQSFHNHFNIVRALTCQRAGIVLAKSGAGSVRNNVFYNCESLGCDVSATDGYQWLVVGGGNILVSPDVEDQQNSGQSAGIKIGGVNQTIIGGHFSALNPYAIDCANAQQTRIQGITCFRGSAPAPMTAAIRVQSSCTNTIVEVDDDFGSNASDTSIQNQDTTALIFSGGEIFFGNASTSFDFPLYANVVGDGSALAIDGGILSITSAYHVVQSESVGSADSVSQIRDENKTQGVGRLTNGQRLVLRGNSDGDAITVSHDSGAPDNRILTSSAADVVLTDEEDAIELIFDSTLVAWLEI